MVQEWVAGFIKSVRLILQALYSFDKLIARTAARGHDRRWNRKTR